MKCDAWPMAASLCLVTACSGPGNDGRTEIPAELVAAVPWTNGAIPLRDAMDFLVVPNEPVYPPISSGTADPGSRAVDCDALADIELSPWVETFEADPTVANSVGIAEAWSSYDDESWGAFRVPGDVSWHPGLVSPVKRYSEAWGLAADRITNGPSCDGQPNDWALHFRGGRFNFFGAGAEHPLAEPFLPDRTPVTDELREILPLACEAGSDLCPPEPEPAAATDRVGLPLERADGTQFEPLVPHLYWDLSHYDGITFWARRGPDGQPGLLIAVQDKHTSDALNREHQTFCRRIKPCRPECQNGSACTLVAVNPARPFDAPAYRCVDPEAELPLSPRPGGGSLMPESALIEELYPVCGPDACLPPGHFPDPDLVGTECKFYEFSGSQAGNYCYGSVPPPPDEERCGDAWVAPVHLSTDWQLYAIPFSEFRQVGFGKRAPFFDLHSINMIALLFSVGFADVYVDNVSFYRRRR